VIYVILGQTASGKTKLASDLARRFHLPLIGADAYQVYQELNIGTAKPNKEELEGLEYFLIDDRSVASPLNVMTYQKECRAVLDQYQKEKRDVILSGGTLLYVRAALYPYEFASEEERPEITGYVNSLTPEEALKLLEEKDRETFEKVDRNNPRRVSRALVLALEGKKASEKAKEQAEPLYPCKIYAIEIDKDEGNKKIDLRVDEMFEEGLIGEVKSLLGRFDPSLSSLQAIGYKEIIEGLRSGQSEEEMKEKIKLDTRRYAKRQRTFLRHQFPSIRFLSKEEIREEIESDMKKDS
jgi:tRNA dimethylallyltransferase